MPDLPLAPREIPIEVGSLDGPPIVFYHRPPGHALGTRLLVSTIRGSADDEEELLKGLESLDEQEIEEAALRIATSATIDVSERDVRDLITTTFLRAEDEEGEPLRVQGEDFDPRKRTHYEAMPTMWVTTIVSRLLTYLNSLERDLVGNSSSPAGGSEGDKTPSPTSEVGEPELSSTAT